MSKFVKWLIGIIVAAIIVFGGVAWYGNSDQHKDSKTESSHQVKHSKHHDKSSQSKSSETTREASTDDGSSSTQKSASSDNASATGDSQSSDATSASQGQATQTEQQSNGSQNQAAASNNRGNRNPQGAVTSDPNTYVTSEGQAKSAVAGYIRTNQGFDPNRFNLSAHPADNGQGYTVNVSSSQVNGVLGVYHVDPYGNVSRVQ